MLLQLATLKFVARQVARGVGNMGNKTLQLAKQNVARQVAPVSFTLKKKKKSVDTQSLGSAPSRSPTNYTVEGRSATGP